MADDLDLMTRVTHALLMALPKHVIAEDGTRVSFIRLDDPEFEDDVEGVVSPLYVDREDHAPVILVSFNRRGQEALFAMKQVGILRPGLADVCPEVASPMDNPQ